MSRCPEGRSCDWCGPSARTARRLARAPAVDMAEHDPINWWDCDCPECLSLVDDYEADDDGKLYTEPLRVSLIEVARLT